MADVLIVGCGYTGLRLSRRLIDGGHRVAGTTRDPRRATRLAEVGIRPLLVDVAEPDGLRKLRQEAPDVCFYLVPPVSKGEPPAGTPGSTDQAAGEAGSAADDTTGDTGGDRDRPDAVEEVIRTLRRAPLQAFVYGSSTGVYGDRGGAWVDETSVPDPDSPRGRARLEAERTVFRCGWSWDCRPRIGRIAGIYGPGRILRDAIASGRYQVVEGLDAWTNRIHVDDLAAGLAALWRRGEDGRVYNLADGHPHRSADFARVVAELAGLELSVITRRQAEERYSANRLARKLGSKRVSNRRMREELGVEPRYPSFRQGVPAALREEGVEITEG